MSVRPIRFVFVAAVLSLTMLAVSSVALADPPGGQRCTNGEALSNFQSPLEHIFGDFACQYRVFFDGRSFTYCEGDVILGGDNVSIEYAALGLSREEGIAELERLGDRVWIDGVEQQLMRTEYKDGQHPVFGHVVYQHRAFITTLPVGDHVSYWEGTFDGAPDGSATVLLRILPSTDPSCS
jgi:hypothetical protein